MRQGQTQVQFQFPEPPKWAWNLLAGLFALYAVELTSRNVLKLPVDSLIWRPFGAGFEVWQPLTRYLVQGNSVFNVVLSLVVMYFFLPAMDRMFDRRSGATAFGVAAATGTAFALAADLIGLGSYGTLGWSPLVAAMVVYFGLGNPTAEIYLFFVIRIPAMVLAYGSAALAFLSMLAAPGLGSADHFGAIIGAFLYWNFLGPGARRRALLQKSANIERELRGFEVLPGGKNRGDDDIVH